MIFIFVCIPILSYEVNIYAQSNNNKGVKLSPQNNKTVSQLRKATPSNAKSTSSTKPTLGSKTTSGAKVMSGNKTTSKIKPTLGSKAASGAKVTSGNKTTSGTKPTVNSKLASNGKLIWSSGKSGKPLQNLMGHWQKHKKEFSEINNVIEYLGMARNVVKTAQMSKTRANGEKLFYDPKTNTFVATLPDGTPKTMFRPKNGMEYFNKLQ